MPKKARPSYYPNTGCLRTNSAGYHRSMLHWLKQLAKEKWHRENTALHADWYTVTNDKYTLKGFTAAFNKLSTDCK